MPWGNPREKKLLSPEFCLPLSRASEKNGQGETDGGRGSGGRRGHLRRYRAHFPRGPGLDPSLHPYRPDPGGAANAANNAVDLGAQVFPLGVVGEDEQGARLLHYFKSKGVDTTGILTVKNRPTTVKSRIMAGAHHTAKQQVIRIDKLDDKEVSRAVEAKLVGRITALAPKMDALLISDYGLGVMTETVRRSLLSAFAGKIITVDSRHRLGDYGGATLITPNVAEAGPAAGIEIVDEDSLYKAGRALQERLGCRVLITQGPQGMTLFGEDNEKIHLPVLGRTSRWTPRGRATRWRWPRPWLWPRAPTS